MELSDIYQSIRDDTGVTTANMSDTVLLRLTNRGRRRVLNEIRKLDKMFFYDEFPFTTVANQIEYALRDTVNNISIVDVLNVGIKYNTTDTEYTPLKFTDTLYPKDQGISRNYSNIPSFDVKDNSIFIYPVPKVGMAAWGKIYGIKSLPDITALSTEEEIMKCIDAHELIVLATNILVYKNRKLRNDMIDAENDYHRALADLPWYIERFRWPMISEMPSTSHLE